MGCAFTCGILPFCTAHATSLLPLYHYGALTAFHFPSLFFFTVIFVLKFELHKVSYCIGLLPPTLKFLSIKMAVGFICFYLMILWGSPVWLGWLRKGWEDCFYVHGAKSCLYSLYIWIYGFSYLLLSSVWYICCPDIQPIEIIWMICNVTIGMSSCISWDTIWWIAFLWQYRLCMSASMVCGFVLRLVPIHFE